MNSPATLNALHSSALLQNHQTPEGFECTKKWKISSASGPALVGRTFTVLHSEKTNQYWYKEEHTSNEPVCKPVLERGVQLKILGVHITIPFTESKQTRHQAVTPQQETRKPNPPSTYGTCRAHDLFLNNQTPEDFKCAQKWKITSANGPEFSGRTFTVLHSENTNEYWYKEEHTSKKPVCKPVYANGAEISLLGVELPIQFTKGKPTKHQTVTSKQEIRKRLDGTIPVPFKPGFKPAERWIISCTRHDQALEIVKSESNECCTKEMGDRKTTHYRSIPPNGLPIEFCGGKLTVHRTPDYGLNKTFNTWAPFFSTH